MKCAVVYSSETGNTYKLARGIYKGIDCATRFINVEDVDYNEIECYDTIVICYWNRQNTADPDSLAFLEAVKGKNIFAAGTLGAYPTGRSGVAMLENVRAAVRNSGNKLIGEFICQGRIDPVKTERRRQIEKGRPHYLDEEGLKRHIESRNHPDLRDIERAVASVKESLSDNASE